MIFTLPAWAELGRGLFKGEGGTSRPFLPPRSAGSAGELVMGIVKRIVSWSLSILESRLRGPSVSWCVRACVLSCVLAKTLAFLFVVRLPPSWTNHSPASQPGEI